MENKVEIKIFTDAFIPTSGSPDSVGLDVHSAQSAVIEPGCTCVIDTGIRVGIPSGYYFQICPRSGLAAKHGITVLNSPGIIDADYRGEIRVILHNTGKEQFVVSRGDRIAQMILCGVIPHVFFNTYSAEDLGKTVRGEGGFGSTGTK